MRKSTLRTLAVIDWLLLPFLYPAAWLLKIIRRRGLDKLPACRKALVRIGVFPILNQFAEPRFDYRDSTDADRPARVLPGIDWNPAEQLKILHSLTHASELADLPHNKPAEHGFYLGNSFFGAGDAEYWYQIIRARKPKQIFEIGSGYSTLMAVKALAANRADDPAYRCEHICIEPYRRPWLEELPVDLRRQRVETLNGEFFAQLGEDDLLFIDSSHVIRPDGDVLFEYLQLLPRLNKGVIVHVHDIHTPEDYPTPWLQNTVRFWNEQYLLEAFLSDNPNWQIMGALNYLSHHHYDALRAVAPHLAKDSEPRSFYMRKIR